MRGSSTNNPRRCDPDNAPEEQKEDASCPSCGTMLRDPESDGYEPTKHGLCWPCGASELDDALEKLTKIAEILEAVDNRCMAADGPVTPTKAEITEKELKEIYKYAKMGRRWSKGKANKRRR